MQTYQDIRFERNNETEHVYFRVFEDNRGMDPYLDFIPWPIKVSAVIFPDGSRQTTAGGGGGGQNQTPWLSNIDGNDFSLSNVESISVNPSVTDGYFIGDVVFARNRTGVPGVLTLDNIWNIDFVRWQFSRNFGNDSLYLTRSGGDPFIIQSDVDLAGFNLNNVVSISAPFGTNFNLFNAANAIISAQNSIGLSTPTISLNSIAQTGIVAGDYSLTINANFISMDGPDATIDITSSLISLDAAQIFISDNGYTQITGNVYITGNGIGEINIDVPGARQIGLRHGTGGSILFDTINPSFDILTITMNLPTSASGLPSGALWNNGGVVNII